MQPTLLQFRRIDMSKINQLYEQAAESYRAKSGTEYDIKQSKDSLNNELNVADFAKGQRDSRNGLSSTDKSVSYIKGYNFEAHIAQMLKENLK